MFEVFFGTLLSITAHTCNFSKPAHCSDKTEHMLILIQKYVKLTDVCLTPLKFI